MLRTILVPTDGSESAEKAMELAADLAKNYKAKLILLHAWRAGPLPDSLRRMAEVEHMAGGRQSGARSATAELQLPHESIAAPVVEPAVDWRVLETVGESLLRVAKVTAQEMGARAIETILVEGEPVAEILRACEDHKIDLVVMGSRGLSDIKGLLLGSVSHKVTQLAPCPTLTTK